MNSNRGSRLQFRLRTILWLFTILAGALTWISYERDQARERLKARKVISRAGGWYTDNEESVSWLTTFRAFLGGDDQEPVIAACLSKRPFGDEDLAQLHSLKNLRILELDQTLISDAGLAHLEHLPELHYVDLSGTQVSDAAIQQLKKARHKLSVIR